MKKLPRNCVFVSLLGLAALPAFAQTAEGPRTWVTGRKSQNHGAILRRMCGTSDCRNTVVRIDRAAWSRQLADAPREGSGPGIRISLPMPDGSAEDFVVVESAILSPAVAAEYPGIRTYRGSAVENPSAIVHLDLTPSGLHALVLSRGRTTLIDPYQSGDSQTHLAYEPAAGSATQCSLGDVFVDGTPLARFARVAGRPATVTPPDFKIPVALPQLRVFRTALMLTSTYVAQYDGTSAGAVAAATTQMNRVNLIFERDLSVRLQVSGTVVYPSAATQPFPMEDEESSSKTLVATHDNLVAKLGVGAFDIGHGFTGIGGGGVALLGSLCDNEVKGAGASNGVGSVTPLHWINLVAHEFAHQFGANHTFNASGVSGCKSTNINAGTAFEPGSGSTTMSYVGLCTSDTSIQDLQPQEDLVFHAYSLKEMLDVMSTTAKPSASCSLPPAGAALNAAPVVKVPASSYTIPVKTPFVLNASATDSDSEDAGHLSYAWEQLDIGSANPSNEDDGARPLFRSYMPVNSSRRYFPSLKYVLAGTNIPPELYTAQINSGGEGASESKSFRLGEVMPTTDRSMRFRLSVRDNRKSNGVVAGSIGFADLTVRTVAAAGPFSIKSPNGGEVLAGGTTQTVTWNVAGTNAAPINTTSVRISLSTDSGKTWAEVLADAPNTGSATVTLPGAATKTARIRVEAIGNIYYDISDADFAIVASNPGLMLINAVVNSASFQPVLAPNTLFSIFGTNLGTKETANATTVGGASVSVCGIPAVLSSNSGTGAINGLIPAGAAGNATCPVVVTVGGKSTAPFSIFIEEQALGVFVFTSGGLTLPVATHADNSVDGPVASGLKPADPGETIVLWCTGWNQGAPNPGITIGGLDAPVTYFGQSGTTPGLCQINVVVPVGLRSGAVNMFVGELGPYSLWVK